LFFQYFQTHFSKSRFNSEMEHSVYYTTHNNHTHNTNLIVNNNCTERIVSNYLVSLSTELKKAIHSDGECRPELIVGRSEILDIEDISNITNNFLGNTQWHPIYSTTLHNRSLEGLYNRLKEIHDAGCTSPILILVKDMKKRVFGALVSTILQPSDQVYELDHSILFHCRPKFEIFRNMRDNICKVRSQMGSLSITHLEGKGDLWLNSDLTIGRTDEDLPENFEEPIPIPMYLRGVKVPKPRQFIQQPTFKVKSVECWAFGNF